MKKYLLLTVLLSLINPIAIGAQPFNEIRSLDNRRVLYNLPPNFNANMAIFFHGATGNANVLLNDAPTNDLIEKMLAKGFLVVLPDARPEYVEGPYKASWETRTVNNPDTQYVDWIIQTAKQALPQLKKIHLVGGSSGVAMAGRIGRNRDDIAGMLMVNGLDCDQVYVNANNAVATTANFTIPANYPPFLLVASKEDALTPYADKQGLIDKAREAGISAMLFLDTTQVGHNWGSWTMQYHDNMVNWLLKN